MRAFFSKPFFSDYRTIAAIWIILVIVTFLTKGGLNPAKGNNFNIFCGVFRHTIEQLPLYAEYPAEYSDVNHYGPLFSLVIAPFALLPHAIGLLLWQFAIAGAFFYSIYKLPLEKGAKIAIYWIVSLEVLSALQMQQFNLVTAACVAGTYIAVRRERLGLAAFMIVFGTLIKIYGIVGLPFLLFSRVKLRALGWIVIWGTILFIAPMLISSPAYIFTQYGDWFASIMAKNAANGMAVNDLQNISAIGMAHRITDADFSDFFILLPAAILFLLPLLRVSQYRYHAFQWGIVASALMCIILFSTGSESSGYVIAFLGIGIWFVTQPTPRRGYVVTLLVFALLICGFGGSDLMPRYVRKEIIRAYALKALPVLLIWLDLTRSLLVRKHQALGAERRL